MPPAQKVAPRLDPKPRPSAERGKFGVRNPDPNRHYVWAYMQDPDTGREKYEGLGYDVETYRADGPRPGVGRTDKVQNGAEITSAGHVLMSCSRERHDEIVQFGPDGDTGQADADRIERAMVIARGDKDPSFRASIMGSKGPGIGLRYGSGDNDRI